MGGNVFSYTNSIKIDDIEPTVERYFADLQLIFPEKKHILNKEYFKYVGSVGKKSISGDIDFAIDFSTIIDNDFSYDGIKQWGINPKDVKNQFDIFKKRARTATDDEIILRSLLHCIVGKINEFDNEINAHPKKVTSGNIFTEYPQYDQNGTKLDYSVQLDWMIGNIEWLEFSYYSSNYSSNIKGLHRTQLILAMFQNLDLYFNHTIGVKDKKTGMIVANDPKSAIKILEDRYQIRLSKYMMQDYYKLIKVINDFNQKDYDNIIDIYLKILDHTRVDIPLNLQEIWLDRQERLGLTGKFLPNNSMLWEFII